MGLPHFHHPQLDHIRVETHGFGHPPWSETHFGIFMFHGKMDPPQGQPPRCEKTWTPTNGTLRAAFNAWSVRENTPGTDYVLTMY